MKREDENRLADIAERLDRLAWGPRELLADLVRRYGFSVWDSIDGDPPEATGEEEVDRELAERLCAGCPVQDECLELELRLHGTETIGVWGALSEQDRRELHALWQERGGRDGPDEYPDSGDGGDPS